MLVFFFLTIIMNNTREWTKLENYEKLKKIPTKLLSFRKWENKSKRIL